MIARAPGKIVLSGAYAVLEGAPALVAAVDRYAEADASRTASFATPEVRAALSGSDRVPWFDASALREGDRKLGLGSSAAILIASLAAIELARDPGRGDEDLATSVLAPALAAHRAAQGGGSGVDVAASAHGGVLRFQLAADKGASPSIARTSLPSDLFLRVFSSRASASTSEMIARILEAGRARPAERRARMETLVDAAESTASAGDAGSFVRAAAAQRDALDALGRWANVPIVTPEMRAFQVAAGDRGTVMPSGAGGGDIVLFFGVRPWTELESAARSAGLAPLSVVVGARGVHGAPHGLQVERNTSRP